MNKSGVFLVIFFLLLVGMVFPTTPQYYSDMAVERSSSVNEAALATQGGLRISVAEDTGVANGTHANTNFGGDAQLYLGTANDAPWICARSWFKFDLTHLPHELGVQRATMNVYIESEYFQTNGTDEPVGVYYCVNDSWTQMGITWNSQPSFSAEPSDVIDSPASPNMFVPGNWYAWDVTPDVRISVAGDRVLSEVLKFTVEVGTQDAFVYPAKSSENPFHATYLEIDYMPPETTELSVDGITSGPLLEYINTPSPDLGWTFQDEDYGDFQKDYDVELWNDTYYNGTMLWEASHEDLLVIHESGDPGGNYHPFGYADPFRIQMKYPSSELPRSGIVDRLYFITNDAGDLQIEDLEISLLMVPSTTALTANFNANYEGGTPTVVLSRDIFEVSVINNTIEFDVENIFFLSENQNLIIEIRLTNNAGDLVRLARTDSGPGSVAANWGNSEAATTSYAPPARTYDLKIDFLTSDVFKGDPIATNGFPFDTTVGYSGRFQIKYNQSYINREGYIDRIYMRGNSLDDIVFENFVVTVVESPVLGSISNGTWVENYGGATPTVVLDESQYTVKNLGYCLVIDFDNTFYYSNTHDLLFDLQWDSLVSGAFRVLYDSPTTSSFRAWYLHYGSNYIEGSGDAGYDLLIDFVNDETSVTLEDGITLVDGTWYYLRARICDSFGIWSEWATLQFKYEVISEIPIYTTPVADPDPATVGRNLTISLNVTHSLGIYEVSIDYEGMNHTMTAAGDTYSYTWAPATAELLNYTVYMRSNANTWASVDGSVLVRPAAGPLGDLTMLLIIGGAAVVVVVLVVAVMKKKPAKK